MVEQVVEVDLCKQDKQHLIMDQDQILEEPEDLAALTVESAAMAKIPLAGTNWIPGNT